MSPIEKLKFLFVYFFVGSKIKGADTTWLRYLGTLGASSPSDLDEHTRGLRDAPQICLKLPGLTDHQATLCRNQPDSLSGLVHGAQLTVHHCQKQFFMERWNCSDRNDSTKSIFSTTLNAANQETAFIQAMSSAALVFSITTLCSAGNISDCGCDMSTYGRHRLATPIALARTDSKTGPPAPGDKWKWGGCSDNVRYGIRFAKQFLDPPNGKVRNHQQNQKHHGVTYVTTSLEQDYSKEKDSFKSYENKNDSRADKVPRFRRTAVNLMNLHNNNAGRQAVATLIHTKCRCHGVSGSCEFRTCWRSMPPLSQVAELLKERWRSAVRVKRRSKRKLRRRDKLERKLPIRSDQLVYINRSPTYCTEDPERGIQGTSGRVCNITSYGPSGCSELCCGRGFNTHVMERTEKCNCKFVWCCSVKCKICTQLVDVYTCK